MLEQIRDRAGQIERYLKINGETNVTKLPLEFAEKEFIVYAALGWLACQGKVELYTKGKIKIAKLK